MTPTHLSKWCGALLLGAVMFTPIFAQEEELIYRWPGEVLESLDTIEEEAIPESTERRTPVLVESAVEPAIERDFIVYGYIQSNNPRWAYHWHALTHVSLPFTAFNIDGDITNGASTITNRSILYKPGGIADRHGVKVKMTLINSGFDIPTLNTVMQTPSLRTNLATQVAAYVNDPSDNIAGVNLDFEPLPYAAATAAGINSFIIELRGLLNAGKELTYYVGPQYTAGNYPSIGSITTDYLDYVTFSCYPWGGSFSSSPNSITPWTSYRTHVNNFIAAGVPPEKIVLTMGSYGHRWNVDVPSGLEADAYNGSVNNSIGSYGFPDARWEVTHSAAPKTRRWRDNAETPWFASLVSGTEFRTVVYEDEESMEFKLAHALGWPGAEGTGRRLGGVGFWSLAWFNANFLGSFNSRDMETGTTVVKIRTYPHVYQLLQEILSEPGTSEYLIEKWEYDDPSIGASLRSEWDRWRDPAGGSDNVGVTSVTRAIVAAPLGVGRPENSEYANQLSYTFTATANNRFFYRWELLGHQTETSIVDRSATRASFPANAIIRTSIHTASAYPNATIRYIVMDANGQLEQGPAFSLNATGWRTMEWDLTAVAPVGFTTSYNQYNNGNGVLNTAGNGARDIAVIGYLVQGNGVAQSGSVILDELRWTAGVTGGGRYVVNEFRYQPNNAEFIEIHGPAGTIPAGIQIRLFDGTESAYTPYHTINLGGLTVPASGVLAVGAPAVSGVTSSVGFSDGTDDIRNSLPSAIQIYDSTRAEVHDSVMYRAMSGVGNLTRQQTMGVTREGYPWLGEIATGTGPQGAYTKGRWPDGADTNWNFADFGVMPATPGQPNGGFMPEPGDPAVSYNFDTVPAGAFQTYQAFAVGAPHVSLPPVPGGTGTNVYRCVDTSGGGVVGFIGDASLGSDPDGYVVTGHLYIPTAAEPAQAIGIGICGTQGSTFFTANPANTGYETGYWLIYENVAGIGLNNSRADHPGVFEFVHATNTNMSANRSEFLGSATTGALGVTPGNWVSFELDIEPATDTLIARINGNTVYSGSIPDGGPTQGAFQVGFRENHVGGPATNEGTWLSNVTIENRGDGATRVRDWQTLNR